MKISKVSDEHFSNYNMLPNGNEEIDLFGLISVLWAAKIKIVGVILFLLVLAFLFLLFCHKNGLVLLWLLLLSLFNGVN
ncbi:ferric enterobactin transport fepE domain protein [Shigella flexneri 2850-71]|nr:ferric enterobactin transport fepE domain protein [Shigella flexneri 2850-71]